MIKICLNLAGRLHDMKTYKLIDMKTLKQLFSVALLSVAMLAGSAQQANAASPLRFGLKAGVTINEMKFNESAFRARTVRALPAVRCCSL